MRGLSRRPLRSGYRWFSSSLPLLQEKQTSSAPRALFESCFYIRCLCLKPGSCGLHSAEGPGWGGQGIFLTLGQCSRPGPACPQGKAAQFLSPDSSLSRWVAATFPGLEFSGCTGRAEVKGPGQNP